jgi:hypothetical protein
VKCVPVWFGNVFNNKTPDLLLNVRRLISDWDFCQSRQVHQCQVEDCRTKNLQMYWQSVYALVETCNPSSFSFNFSPHSIKICESVAGRVEELGPFRLERSILRRKSIGRATDIYELKNKRTPSYDARAPRKKVAANWNNETRYSTAMGRVVYRCSLTRTTFPMIGTRQRQLAGDQVFQCRACCT